MKRTMRLGSLLAIGLVVVCCLSPESNAAAPEASRLTAQGLAPVHLGMRIAAAERALHARLGRLSRSSRGFATEPESSESCWLWRRRDGQSADITYMTEHGRIVRIDIGAARVGRPASVTTTRGIGIGSALSDLDAAYGTNLHLEPHPLEERSQWTALERDGPAGIRIEVRDGSVSAMFAAKGAALGYSEGCS